MEWGDIASWVAIAASVALGAWGLRQSSRANALSDEALELARAADARASRAEQLQLEPRDVQWTHGWDETTDTFWVENVGSAIAHDVTLWVDPEDAQWRATEHADLAGPRDRITLELSAFAEERRKLFEGMSSSAHLIGLPSMEIRAGVTWNSATGVPGSEAWHGEIAHLI